jgi:hypothetical protein
MIPEYIDLLLEFTPQEERTRALNMFDVDSGGLTPLVALAVAPSFDSNPDLRFQMANKLMALGADKNITDVFGETALGKFRGVRGNFGWGQTPSDIDRLYKGMELLLRPTCGPTGADDSYTT